MILLCIVTAVVGYFFLTTPIYRSRYGERILSKLYTNHQKLRRATATNPQVVLAFALFGSSVLVGDRFLFWILDFGLRRERSVERFWID